MKTWRALWSGSEMLATRGFCNVVFTFVNKFCLCFSNIALCPVSSVPFISCLSPPPSPPFTRGTELIPICISCWQSRDDPTPPFARWRNKKKSQADEGPWLHDKFHEIDAAPPPSWCRTRDERQMSPRVCPCALVSLTRFEFLNQRAASSFCILHPNLLSSSDEGKILTPSICSHL